MGPVVLAPEPLYPRGPDNTSDDTDAALDAAQQDLRTANAWNAALEKRVKELEGAVRDACAHSLGSCGCTSSIFCADAVLGILKGVR